MNALEKIMRTKTEFSNNKRPLVSKKTVASAAKWLKNRRKKYKTT